MQPRPDHPENTFPPRLSVLMGGRRDESPIPGSVPPRTLAVASGKGGVGKTSLSVNLALALASLGRRALVVDADFGLGKVDLLLGEEPDRDLSHVLTGEATLAEVVRTGPQGVSFLPGACGYGPLATLDTPTRERLLQGICSLAESVDFMILDLATGIGPNVVELARRADDIVLVTAPEPTATADAYALMKILHRSDREPPRVVVNRVQNGTEARDTFLRISGTARKHLGVTPTDWGFIPEDETVREAVRRQSPFFLTAPNSAASRRVRELARRVLRDGSPGGGDPETRSRLRSQSSPETAWTVTGDAA